MQDAENLVYKESDLVRKGKGDWFLKITAEDQDKNERLFVPEITNSEWREFFNKYNGVPTKNTSGKPLSYEEQVERKMQILDDFAKSKLEQIKLDTSYELTASQPDRIRAVKTKEDQSVDQFTESLLSKIEGFEGHWEKPWFSEGAMVNPQNLSGREYHGFNSLLLALNTDKNNYTVPVYATFNQFTSLNEGKENKGLPRVSLNKGAKSSIVSNPPVFIIRNKDTGEKISYSDFKQLSKEEKDNYIFRKYPGGYNHVFNIDQSNLKEARPEMYKAIVDKLLPKQTEANDVNKMISFPAVDKMISDNLWVCPIKPTKGDEAYFAPKRDIIVVPLKEQFKDGESFYTNLFHEMTHSTGVESRLNRQMSGGFGSSNYAREELVAEITAAYLGLQNGMNKHLKKDTLPYVKGWAEAIKGGSLDTKKLIEDISKAKDMVSTRINDVDKEMSKGLDADYSRFRNEAQSQSEPQVDNRKQEVSDMMNKLQSNIIEIGENVFHIGYDQEKNTLYAGGATNAGVMREVEKTYDFDLGYNSRDTFDKNLEELHNSVEEYVNSNEEQENVEEEEEQEETRHSSMSR